ncbi:hypothetical protein GCK72_016854 [Caenorhabditis remanei]|uniref:Uncharacterized protein n=1 Tax=Caenorhabditis remanei TaxID=31234 RepID=A0A6A5G608_CAERE|nr:hypothetical protein GCK72_016854 [Caenorhabditis remanei]KAF1750306.1 hypothetical protein GCK72_016854 [Caenorhabditis remanei]
MDQDFSTDLTSDFFDVGAAPPSAFGERAAGAPSAAGGASTSSATGSALAAALLNAAIRFLLRREHHTINTQNTMMGMAMPRRMTMSITMLPEELESVVPIFGGTAEKRAGRGVEGEGAYLFFLLEVVEAERRKLKLIVGGRCGKRALGGLRPGAS